MKYSVNALPEQIPGETLDLLLQAETATIGHFRLLGFSDPAIKPLVTGKRLAGTAVTLALPGLDSTLLHHVTSLLRPGDVLLIDRLGDRRHSCLGGGVGYALKKRGVTAAVIDGPCNDPYELVDYDFPVWSRGISPVTTQLLNSAGAFNVPINCGGAVVLPGYAVLLDDNGVLVIPPGEVEATAERALNLQRLEKDLLLPKIDAMAALGELSGASTMVLEAQRQEQG